MVNNNNKGKKQPPKATLDLKAKDITEKAPKTQASKTSNTTPKVTISSSSGTSTVGAKNDGRSTAQTSKSAVPSTTAKTSSAAKTSPSTARKDDLKAKAAAKTVAAKSPAPQKKSGGGFFSNLLSAAIGGVVALFGMSYAGGPDSLMKMTGLPAGSNSEISILKQDIAALKQNKSGTSLAALEQKIAALESNQKQLANASNSSNDQKIAELEASLQQLTQTAASGGKSAIASAAIVKKQIKAAGVADFKKQVLDLRKQNTAVQNEQAKLHEGMTTIAEEQAKLHSNIAKMREDTAKLKNSAAKLSSQVAQGPDLTSAMAPLIAKITQFEGQIAKVQDENKQAKSEGRNIALAIELSNLKRVLSKGQPFTMELDRIKPHIPTGLDIALLERYAPKGLPNIGQLDKSLTKQMDLIMASELQEEDTSTLSWQDKLLAKAKSAMKMRPTGYVKGDTTDAVLARIEYKLKKKGDLAGALQEATALQAKPAEAAKGWIQTAQDRLAGDKLLQQLEEKLMGGLRGSAQ